MRFDQNSFCFFIYKDMILFACITSTVYHLSEEPWPSEPTTNKKTIAL